jgi:PHD/YefM family antitoxin component YafN of YafNO toxin-antitoxin module
MMSKLPLAEVQAHLREIFLEIAATGEPMEIECEGLPNMLIIPKDINVADEEMTRRIMGSPENAKRLREDVERARRGEGVNSCTFDELCKSVGIDANSL